nr:MAG TPA: hypothetical protein [Bacteriophage sp.]
MLALYLLPFFQPPFSNIKITLLYSSVMRLST